MIDVIYDNVIFSLQKSGGISVYWKELIERIQKEDSVRLKILEYSNAETNIFRKSLRFDTSQLKFLNSFPSLNIRRYINPRVNVRSNSIFHSSYYRTVRSSNIKNIVTVHDFTYEKKINSFSGKIHIHQKKRALRNSDGIICISENTKKDMLEIYPELKNKKTKVIYNGFNSNDYISDKNIIIENQALFVGARESYKNFDKAVEAVSETRDITLVIVGVPLTENERSYLESKLPNRYQSFTHISNKELNKLYNQSICLLYLSEYEGFGIPVLEAMSSGCPVIALNKSSIPEVAGDACILFSNYDKKKVQIAIESLRDDKDLRSSFVELGKKNAKNFSWDNCYKEVLDFYHEIL